MRPLTAEEMSPIHPEVDDKLVVVNLTEQTLSCYEGAREVLGRGGVPHSAIAARRAVVGEVE